METKIKDAWLQKAESLQETINDAVKSKTAITKEFASKTFAEIKELAKDSKIEFAAARLHALPGADPSIIGNGNYDTSIHRVIEFLKNEIALHEAKKV
jgi:hypothetical protein